MSLRRNMLSSLVSLLSLSGAAAVQPTKATGTNLVWDDQDVAARSGSDFYMDGDKKGVCRSMYTKAMKALFEEAQAGVGGSTLVLGANDGKSYDPATEMFDFWNKVPNLRKVFVEPVPPLFMQLQENTKGYKNVELINKAMRIGAATASPELKLFCWDMDVVDRSVKTGQATLPAELRQPMDYWKALCSSDRSSVVDRSNVFDERFFKLNETRKAAVKSEVEAHILPYLIGALSPDELISQYNLEDTKYLQIDVEGLDDLVIKALPLGKSGFKPKVILHEWEGNHNDEIPTFFKNHGYDWCGSFWHAGHNAIAVLKSDPEVSLPVRPLVRREARGVGKK